MSFYLGKYLLDQESLDPLHTGAWFMPDKPTQHMAETSNVEELQVLPTDMDSIPTQIQFGACSWTDEDEGDIADGAYQEFYTSAGAFYVRSFSAGSDLYGTFYTNAGAFYVRSFTAGEGIYGTFYTNTGAFYVRSFSEGRNLYGTFYTNAGAFYVQGFAPVDFFYPIAEDC